VLSGALSYASLVALVWYFIIRERRSVSDAFLLGFLVYAVYETTNKATLKDWTWSMVVMDSVWGGTLFALTTYIFYKLV